MIQTTAWLLTNLAQKTVQNATNTHFVAAYIFISRSSTEVACNPREIWEELIENVWWKTSYHIHWTVRDDTEDNICDIKCFVRSHSLAEISSNIKLPQWHIHSITVSIILEWLLWLSHHMSQLLIFSVRLIYIIECYPSRVILMLQSFT